MLTRRLLKCLDEALILESKIIALQPPDSGALRAFRNWFFTVIPVLWGRDKNLYDDTNDLVTLAPTETDRLNAFLQRHLGWWFRKENAEMPERSRMHNRSSGLFYYPRHRVQLAGAVLSTLLSAFLLVGAIVCLLSTSTSSNAARLGVIVLFTCIFAMVVGLLTNARRAEIFGATAA